MARKEKTQKLYVNLGASQARRRLKGHGLGVRRVESAGRHQAVIVHTATGQHLRQLRGLLADASPATSQDKLGTPIENLRNLGPTSARWLAEIGVATGSELRTVGAALAYRLVKQRQPTANLNLLWALAGALADKDWRDLTATEKSLLKREVELD